MIANKIPNEAPRSKANALLVKLTSSWPIEMRQFCGRYVISIDLEKLMEPFNLYVLSLSMVTKEESCQQTKD